MTRRRRKLLSLLEQGVGRLRKLKDFHFVCGKCNASETLLLIENDYSTWSVRCQACRWQGSAYTLMIKALEIEDPGPMNARRLSLSFAADVVAVLFRRQCFPMVGRDFEFLGAGDRTGREVNRNLSLGLLWLLRHRQLPLGLTNLKAGLGEFFENGRWRRQMRELTLVCASVRLPEMSLSWNLRPYRPSEDYRNEFKEADRTRPVHKQPVAKLKVGKRLESRELEMSFATKKLMNSFPWSGIKADDRGNYLRSHMTLRTHLMSRTLRSESMEGFLVTCIVLGPKLKGVLEEYPRERRPRVSNELPRSRL